ncbi:MAG: aminotransferase class I/II-fold pyridoxal phosphate-dependent enzyme, partial [Planctomycetes bacterium]|nr:aminotransferase class I/II-fold pyridoxal phosphate-dependent enzyme [Planctomycetota bacterium]
MSKSGRQRSSRERKSRLALLGGPKAITLKAEEALRWPVTGKPEIDAVTSLIKKGELSISEETKKLEEEFADFIGVRYALAHNNGTSAGHAAFFALNIQPGDEVICPSFTYWASIVQVLPLGGVPVFCEMDPDTLNIDPLDIERKITSRTKAIVVVH